jgi:flagellar biogenesis protein FliO
MFISKSFSFNKYGAAPRDAGVGFLTLSGFAALGAWFKRFIGSLAQRRVGGGALEHLATLPLGAQPSLVLVRLGHETLLLGATARQINLLARAPSEVGDLNAFDEARTAPEESARQ